MIIIGVVRSSEYVVIHARGTQASWKCHQECKNPIGDISNFSC